MIKLMSLLKEDKMDNDKIIIEKSPTADTRTCNTSKVTVEQLLDSSKMHIEDVKKGMNYVADLIKAAAEKHDWTKIDRIDQFYKDFKNDFETQDWYEGHKRDERHHIAAPDGVRDDVDLVDVIEFLVDGIMAGLAHSGTYRKEDLPDGLLQKAFDNTVDKLINIIKVEE